MLESFEAEHDPVTPTEEALVVQLALANWRLRRLSIRKPASTPPN
jgi:hypothetical protein